MLIAIVLRVDGTGIKVQFVSVVIIAPGRGPPMAIARSTLISQRPISLMGPAGIDARLAG